MAAGNETGLVAMALAASTAGAAVRLAAAAWTGSSAMLAEAVHALVAAASQGLTLFGIARAGRISALYPAAAARDVHFWTLVVTILMFSLGAGVALYEGIAQLIGPHPVTDPMVNAAALAVAFALTGASAAKAFAAFKASRGPAPALAALSASRDPVRFTVLIQAVTALAGLTVAAAGLALSYATGSPTPDGCAAVVIGLLLGAVAAVMSLEVRRHLLGDTAPAEERAFFIEEPDFIEEPGIVDRGTAKHHRAAHHDARNRNATEDHRAPPARATDENGALPPASSPPPAPSSQPVSSAPPHPAERHSRKERKRRKHQK